MLIIDSDLLFEVFCLGVDYGQLTMEREREQEELFDAFNGYVIARKTAMPSNPTPRRQPHSEKWRNAKKQGWENFKNYCKEYYGGLY